MERHVYFLYGIQYTGAKDLGVFFNKLIKNSRKYATMSVNRDVVSLGAITVEPLPLPIVFYPNLYGSFFAFSDDIDPQIYFCECEKKAIENFIKLKKMSIRDNEPEWIRSLDHEFPNVGKELLKDYFKNSYRKIPYKKGICFRCNGITPKKIYCHPMYGGKFKQHYGWYINQEYYKLGIDKGTFTKMYVLPEECTPELYDSLQQINKLIASKKEIYDNDNEIRELRKSLERTIENSVREQLGFKKIGDAWISETMLYNIVKNLYPNQKIIRHYRPQWLDGLELDIFVPNLKIGLEYQGIQHFKAVEHWGDQKQLKKQQEHDTKKKKMCSELGINLVCINYDDPLTSEYVSKRILEQLEK